jgi:Asp-tRNA(Asn)/Glu-tRNA(Gln) amidotransferase A subunit family amidase
MAYEATPVKAPRLSGLALRLLAGALETGAGAALLMPGLLRQLGLPRFRALRTDAPPTFYPWVEPEAADRQAPAASLTDVNVLASRHRAGAGGRPGVADYARAYRERRTTPEAVAEATLRAMRDADAGREPPLRAFVACDEADVRAQARDSGARWQRGQPLSVFDGVPVAVKDELDQAPYRTTGGSRVLGAAPAAADAVVVGRLRAAGALLVGKTNMHEIGLGVTGMNPITGFARNPWNPQHATGGSSAGSAAAVAAGLVPVAIGADGGGSIRIPASLCGVVGLKPTYGRLSERGALSLCWSVGHVGPLAGTALDCALAYAVCAGPGGAGGDWPDGRSPPPARLDELERGDLGGLRLGVYRPWFQDARPGVVKACEAMLAFLVDRGARVVEVEIPGLEAIFLAHGLTIASEIAASMAPVYQAGRQHALSAETRINLALARQLQGVDYVQAQRVRSEALAGFRAAFAAADVILTPATGCPAPAIRPQALAAGESDLAVLSELMRFVVAANLTGVPAISFPAGYDEAGLPVGLQAMAPWWQEHRLLRLALAAEAGVPRRKPAVFYQVID